MRLRPSIEAVGPCPSFREDPAATTEDRAIKRVPNMTRGNGARGYAGTAPIVRSPNGPQNVPILHCSRYGTEIPETHWSEVSDAGQAGRSGSGSAPRRPGPRT